MNIKKIFIRVCIVIILLSISVEIISYKLNKMVQEVIHVDNTEKIPEPQKLAQEYIEKLIRNYVHEQNLLIVPIPIIIENRPIKNNNDQTYNFFMSYLTEEFINEILFTRRNDQIRKQGIQKESDNFDIKCFMIKTHEVINHLSKVEHIPERPEYDLISLKIKLNSYDGINFCGPNGSWLKDYFNLDFSSKAIYTFKGEDFERVKKLVEQGNPLENAIIISAKEKLVKMDK